MAATLADAHRLASNDETFTRMQVEGFTSQLTKLDKRFGATAGQASLTFPS